MRVSHAKAQMISEAIAQKRKQKNIFWLMCQRMWQGIEIIGFERW